MAKKHDSKPKPAKARTRAAPKRSKAKRQARPVAVKRGMHDLGGLPGGPIDREHHTLSPFEERVDAMMMVLTNQYGLYKVDALRRTIEDFSTPEYRDLAYYEKWMLAIRRILVEQGVLADGEVDAKMREIEANVADGESS